MQHAVIMCTVLVSLADTCIEIKLENCPIMHAGIPVILKSYRHNKYKLADNGMHKNAICMHILNRVL